jgi:hypothetical protein
MGDLLIEIEELYARGFSADEISKSTGMTIRFVLEAIQHLEPDFLEEEP